MRATFDRPIVMTASDRASMDRQLDEAVATTRAKAMHERCRGILVTRHGYDTFTVDLSDAVPFGLTREHQDW